jgi:hypothetical protein
LLPLNRGKNKGNLVFPEGGSMGRSFYVYPNKKGIYLAEILNPETGVRVCIRNTGEKTRDEALLLANDWVRNGIPKRKRGRAPMYQKPRTLTVEATSGLAEVLKYCKTGDIDEAGAMEIVHALKSRGLLSIGVSPAAHGKQSLIKYLFNFWDYEKSEYLRDKRAHGKDVTKRYCVEAARKIKRNWQPYFGDMLLAEITRKNLKDFGIAIHEQGLASATVNNEMSVGITALKWAYHEKLIPEDVTAELMGFSGDEKKRDMFTQEEAMKLLDTDTYLKESRKVAGKPTLPLYLQVQARFVMEKSDRSGEKTSERMFFMYVITITLMMA